LVSSESISEAILNLDFSEAKLDPKIVHSGAKILNFEADLREVLELAGLDAAAIIQEMDFKFNAFGGSEAQAIICLNMCARIPDLSVQEIVNILSDEFEQNRLIEAFAFNNSSLLEQIYSFLLEILRSFQSLHLYFVNNKEFTQSCLIF
jgi:hypothetical protein